MKKIILAAIAVLAFKANAGKDVTNASVNFIYQLDSDATIFEFNASVANGCGSSTYRVKSPNEAVANRKFSLVLTAFTAKKTLSFHDTEICESGRSVVAWIRLLD